MTPTSHRLRPGQPAIIAHRGVPERLPENTLAGFALAIAEGADGIELDVHLSADGQVVVHHDDEVRPPGSARGGMSIVGHSLGELRSFSGAELPTLADVLEVAGQQVMVWVELKGRQIERQVVDAIGAGHSTCAIHAFDHLAIRRAHQLAPQLPSGILLVARPVDPVAILRAAGAVTLWQEWTMIDEELVREVHSAGGEVVAWTVNAVDAAVALSDLGVDAICTDHPGRLCAALRGSD